MSHFFGTFALPNQNKVNMRLKNLNKKLSEVIYNYWNDVVTNIERPSMEWIEWMMSECGMNKDTLVKDIKDEIVAYIDGYDYIYMRHFGLMDTEAREAVTIGVGLCPGLNELRARLATSHSLD